MGCTEHELIDLPCGDVKGSINFQDIDYNNYPYPGGTFQIKAQNDSQTCLALPNENGAFSFSNLPTDGLDFTFIENEKEVMTLNHCSFLGGGEPSYLNFYFRIQPDIKNIDYHFEISNDTIWILGKVELDGTPPVECNKIMLYSSFPPNNDQYYDRIVPFDWESKQIKYMVSKVYDLKSGDQINSYFYKKYREYGANFRNYVIKQTFYGSNYDDLRCSYKSASDSTAIYKFIVP